MPLSTGLLVCLFLLGDAHCCHCILISYLFIFLIFYLQNHKFFNSIYDLVAVMILESVLLISHGFVLETRNKVAVLKRSNKCLEIIIFPCIYYVLIKYMIYFLLYIILNPDRLNFKLWPLFLKWRPLIIIKEI